jgi:hypothetical protein
MLQIQDQLSQQRTCHSKVQQEQQTRWFTQQQKHQHSAQVTNMCAMCGCNSEAFMGVELPNQNVYDVGPGQMPSPEMFGTDTETWTREMDLNA